MAENLTAVVHSEHGKTPEISLLPDETGYTGKLKLLRTQPGSNHFRLYLSRGGECVAVVTYSDDLTARVEIPGFHVRSRITIVNREKSRDIEICISAFASLTDDVPEWIKPEHLKPTMHDFVKLWAEAAL